MVTTAPRGNSASSRSVDTNASSSEVESGFSRICPSLVMAAGFNRILNQSARTELPLQQRLDLCLDGRIRVTRPRHLGLNVQWRVDRPAIRIGHDHPTLLCNERGADVVRMARERRGIAATAQQWTHQGPQVGNKTIVTGQKFVELPAGGRILIFKAVRLARWSRAKRAADDRFVDRGWLVAYPRKEARNRGVPVRDRRGRGRT